MRITVHKPLLKVLLESAHDSKPILSGIHITATHLEATDGHRICWVKLPTGETEYTDKVLTADWVKARLKASPRAQKAITLDLSTAEWVNCTQYPNTCWYQDLKSENYKSIVQSHNNLVYSAIDGGWDCKRGGLLVRIAWADGYIKITHGYHNRGFMPYLKKSPTKSLAEFDRIDLSYDYLKTLKRFHSPDRVMIRSHKDPIFFDYSSLGFEYMLMPVVASDRCPDVYA